MSISHVARRRAYWRSETSTRSNYPMAILYCSQARCLHSGRPFRPMNAQWRTRVETTFRWGVVISPYAPAGSRATRVSIEDEAAAFPVGAGCPGTMRLMYLKLRTGRIEAVDLAMPGFAPSNRRDFAEYAGVAQGRVAVSVPGTDRLTITCAGDDGAEDLQPVAAS
jgi:hypothetical protein